MSLLKVSKLRQNVRPLFRVIFTALVITMIVHPAHAEWDPNFETPTEFNRNEWKRANRQPASKLAGPPRVAQVAPEEPEVAPESLANPPAPEQVPERSSSTSRKLRGSRAADVSAAPPVVDVAPAAPAVEAAPAAAPSAGPSKLSHSAKGHSAKVRPSAIVDTPIAQPVVESQPQPEPVAAPVAEQPAAAGPSKLRHSAKVRPSSVAAEPEVAPQPIAAPPVEAAAVVEAPKPSVHSSKPNLSSSKSAKPNLNAESASEVMPASSDRQPEARQTEAMPIAPAAAAEVCAPALAPKTGVAQTASATRDLQEAIAQAGPKAGKNVRFMKDNDEEEVKEYSKEIGDKLPTKVRTEAKAPRGAFMKRFLEAARRETERPRKGIRDPMKPKLRCLEAVRMAIQIASKKPLHGLTNSAKDAGPHLKQYGFTKAAPGKYTAFNAPVGSVLIYRAKGSPKAHGHIEIRGENGYYSDFFSKNPISVKVPSRELIGVYLPPTT